MTFQIQDAKKSLVKVRILMTGVSGSGKSLGGLYMAKGLLEPGQQLVVIDTEHGRINEYEGLFPFRVISFDPPFTPELYIKAMELAVRETANLGILMIDSISHEWRNIENAKDAWVNDHSGCNPFTAWEPFTRRHEAFLYTMLHLPCHVIATARAKTKYVVGEGNAPVKVGVKSILREETDFDFNPEFNFIHNSHHYTVKSSSVKIDGDDLSALNWHGEGDVMNERHGKLLYDHLHSGASGVMSRTAMKDVMATIPQETRKMVWDNWDTPPDIKTPSELNDEKYAEYYELCTQEQTK